MLFGRKTKTDDNMVDGWGGFFRHWLLLLERVGRGGLPYLPERVKTTAIRKLKKPTVGLCDVCETNVPLEFLDVDCGLTLCNECAGHFAVAEFWLYRFGLYPCTAEHNDRGVI